MIHIIIAIIRAIIRYNNKTNATTSTQASTVKTTTAKSQNFNRGSSSSDDKKGLAIIIAIISTFCCSFSFLINIGLAIATKKIQQIFIALAILCLGIFLLYSYDSRKTEIRLNIRPIVYNDSLEFQLNDEDSITMKIKDYFEEKYASWLSTANLSSSEKAEIKSDYSIMALDVLITSFDNIQVGEKVMTNTSIYQIWQDHIKDYENDISAPINCKVYLDDMSMHKALNSEEKKIKEKIADSSYLTDHIMQANIVGFCFLFVLTFIQGLYLWIQFFKQRNSAGVIPPIVNTTIDKEYTPQVTTNNLKAQAVKQTASTKSSADNKQVAQVVSPPSGKMDINSIDVYQLLTIPGLSYSQALLIISERTDKGKYSDLEELMLRNKLDATMGELLKQKIYFGI